MSYEFIRTFFPTLGASGHPYLTKMFRAYFLLVLLPYYSWGPHSSCCCCVVVGAVCQLAPASFFPHLHMIECVCGEKEKIRNIAIQQRNFQLLIIQLHEEKATIKLKLSQRFWCIFCCYATHTQRNHLTVSFFLSLINVLISMVHLMVENVFGV